MEQSTSGTLERVDIPLPADNKRLPMQEDESSGNTPTALVLDAALDKPRDILQSHQHFVLGAKEWRDFIAVLNEPPEPTEALRDAWRDATR